MLAQQSGSPEEVNDQLYATAVWYLFTLTGNVDLETKVLLRLSFIDWALVAKLRNELRYDADGFEAFIQKVRLKIAGPTPQWLNFHYV